MTENTQNNMIGNVIGGGLKEGLYVRLDVPSNTVHEGAFIVIEEKNWLYYGLVIDLQLNYHDPHYASESMSGRYPQWIAKMIDKQTLFTNLKVLPTLMLDLGQDPDELTKGEDLGDDYWEIKRPQPVKTVPPHHSPVRMAAEDDINMIFGDVEKEGNFTIGYTREQGHPVAINLEKFIQRSSGVFGATGTGKSYLTRLILAGLVNYDTASLLVFDMHNEYGYGDTSPDTGIDAPGLKTKFNEKIRIAGLGSGSMIKGKRPDFDLEIPMRDIHPEDILMLSRILNLRDTTPVTLDQLVSSFGSDKWFEEFMNLIPGKVDFDDDSGKSTFSDDSIEGWARNNNIHAEAAKALHSKLKRVMRRDYIKSNPASNGLNEIIQSLKTSKHVVLSFDKYESDLDYLLVSNLITRKIRQVWEKDVNDFRSKDAPEPRPLVLVIEEAHKLLNREIASQTTFSTIAREMRKYYVTLLIVDQRPSQIYDEVMSQLGTRVSGWLGDDDDIRAVLSGLSGRDALKGMLARLQPKEEVMLMGWGVPMPLPIASRRYDDRFWKELLGEDSARKSTEQNLEELGF
jgi:DNA helicase HerA-like ATPase